MLRRSLRALVLVLVVTACSSGSDAKGPTATVASSKPAESTTTTAEPKTPEQEVEAAYLKSWDVYAKAVRELDDSHLESAYADTALTTVRTEVQRLKGKATPVKVRVEHHYTIQVVAPDRAVVVDSYANHSVFVDPNSGVPTERDPNERLVETYTIKNIEGSWKVVGITRQ